MSAIRFLKLGNNIINTASIRRVVLFPDKYVLEFMPCHGGAFVLGSGVLSTDSDTFVVHRNVESETKIELEKWMNSIVKDNQQ
jgi:hypothetical protein